MYNLTLTPLIGRKSFMAVFFIYSIFFGTLTSHGLGAGFGNGTPLAASRSRLSRPIAHAAVPRFRPHTSPTAAMRSIISLDGLN